jgi:hypothetical protein
MKGVGMMKRYLWGLIAALALAAPLAVTQPPPARAVVATTKFLLNPTTWTDLGAGPLLVSFTGSAVYAVSDTTPTLVSEGLQIPSGTSLILGNTASHVWAISIGPGAANAFVAPINASGGGGGTLTAGSSSTSGFGAGQLLMSDGSKLQPASGVATERNGVSANALRVYNTYTDASNGEWGALDWQTTPNVLTIGTQANGTGTARNLEFVSGGSLAMDFGINIGPAWATIYRSLSLSGGGLLASGALTAPGIVSSVGVFSQPTITGTGGTCAASTKVGGATAGTVVLSGICAAGNTVVFTGMPAIVNNGFACDAENRNLPASLFVETASTTTGFTLTASGTSSAAGNVLQWKCTGY